MFPHGVPAPHSLEHSGPHLCALTQAPDHLCGLKAGAGLHTRMTETGEKGRWTGGRGAGSSHRPPCHQQTEGLAVLSPRLQETRRRPGSPCSRTACVHAEAGRVWLRHSRGMVKHVDVKHKRSCVPPPQWKSGRRRLSGCWGSRSPDHRAALRAVENGRGPR